MNSIDLAIGTKCEELALYNYNNKYSNLSASQQEEIKEDATNIVYDLIHDAMYLTEQN